MKQSNLNGLGIYKPYTGIYDVKTPFSSLERIEAQKEEPNNLDDLLKKYNLIDEDKNMKSKICIMANKIIQSDKTWTKRKIKL